MDASSTWVTVRVDRVLYVHRGINTIFCTEEGFRHGAELVLKLSEKQKQQLLDDLKS